MFLSVAALSYAAVPLIFRQTVALNKGRAESFARKMDRVLLEDEVKKVSTFYVLGPFVLGLAGVILFSGPMRLVATLVGIGVGFLFPKMYANILVQKRKAKFEDQLIDSLMIMSSSFRGGLSLIQAVEAVAEEMPDPIRHEFNVVLGENKMGVALDESFNRLYRRMPSPPLQQMISAILLARETGGNLPLIFSRIVHTMRERKKIQGNLKALTMQGKIQAAVMSMLPIGFFIMVSTTNPSYFDVMTQTETGQRLLTFCAIMWCLGTFFIVKISSLKDI